MEETTAAELVSCLRGRGVELRTEEGRLCFSASREALTPELRNELVRRKSDILAVLRQERESAGPGRAAHPFEKLLEPMRLGRLELRNRMVLSPMQVDLGSPAGEVTQRTVDYYGERARGGAGLVIVEATDVDSPTGSISPHQLRADADRCIPGLARLARAVQGAGAGAVLQLQHAGRKASSQITGQRPVAPSAVASHAGETPRELAGPEIEELVRRFAEAAARAELAGFDGVEIHAAHGYLVSQFLSPFYNRRQDGYGGPVEGRARFLLEIVGEIRRRVGRDFLVLCRLSAVEYEVAGAIRQLPGGATVEEAQRVAPLLEAAGVAAIDVSATLVGPARMHPMAWPEGQLAACAEAVKSTVSVPVSLTSRVPPRLAEELLRHGRIDLVRLGRALLADPALPRKLAAGRVEDIVPCIHCSVCLDPRLRRPEAVCAVNPRLGREGEPEIGPAAACRRVFVVGGGPAGLEAARVAALRGHEVHLFEQAAALGGQMLVPSKPGPARETFDSLRRYLVRQVESLGVAVHLGRPFTPELAEEGRPDLVVLATGARPAPPSIPGAAREGVLQALDVLAGAETGARVAVVGGELVGCETALVLAGQGRHVVLLGRRPELATRVAADVRRFLLWAVRERGVAVFTRSEVEEIVPGGLVFRDGRGERELLRADSVVLATGARPETGLLPALAARVPRLIRAGDCNAPRGILEAIQEGHEAGLSI